MTSQASISEALKVLGARIARGQVALPQAIWDRHLLARELLAVGDCGRARLSGLVHSMAGYRVHCLEEHDGL